MSTHHTIQKIKAALDDAPPNGYTAELHLQIIKHSDALQNMTGKEFCAIMGIGTSFGTEFSKMRNIADRLKAADLDLSKI